MRCSTTSPNPISHTPKPIPKDLDMPDAPRIKQLEDMLEGKLCQATMTQSLLHSYICADEDMEEFKKEYGHCSAFSLSDVFWTCSTMLATRCHSIKSSMIHT